MIVLTALTVLAAMLSAIAVPAARADVAATRAASRPVSRVWQPPAHTDWMWELGQPLDTRSSYLMGTGVAAWNGDRPPADNPAMYDIDAIENSAAVVARLHARGDRAVCYIEVGSAGDYYPAAQERIPVTYFAQLKAAGLLGRKLPDYNEFFININAARATTIIESMIRQQCAAKGFDAVETDLDETFGGNEGPTGFRITRADEEAYLAGLAAYMHRLGLAWIAKNLDVPQDAAFVRHLAPLAQGIITESCRVYRTCALLGPFRTAGKWIGDAEYGLGLARFCPADNAADMNGILFSRDLAGGRLPCR